MYTSGVFLEAQPWKKAEKTPNKSVEKTLCWIFAGKKT
jgi:hypothetical protein